MALFVTLLTASRRCLEMNSFFYRHARRILALGLIACLYLLARLPELSTSERSQLAAHFRFEKSVLPEVPGPEQRSVRPVNPSLRRIPSWISSVGAAVALNDLDGDHAPAGSNYFRHDRGVVTHAAAHVIDAIAALQMQRVDPTRERAGLAVINVLGGIQRDNDIVVEVARLASRPVRQLDQPGGGQRPYFSGSNLPGWRTEELLARHAGESLDERRRCQVGGLLDFLGVETAV